MGYRNKKRNRFLTRTGSSLIGVLISMVLAGVLLVSVLETTVSGIRGAKFAEVRQDLETLRMSIRDSIDCEKTLELTAPPTTKLNCADYSSVILKRKDNTDIAEGGKLGNWNITAGCKDNHIKVQATAPGSDPLTKKTYASSTYATDLYRGLGLFCENYFTGGTATGEMKFGGTIARCPFNQVAGSPSSVVEAKNFGDKSIPPTAAVNPATGTHYCPDGYDPHIATAFWNSGCDGPQKGWYYQCGWHSVTGAPVSSTGAAPWADAQYKVDSSGSVWSDIQARGCGIEIYNCLQKVTN